MRHPRPDPAHPPHEPPTPLSKRLGLLGLLLALCASACGEDEGQEPGPADLPLTSKLPSIQAHIFDRRCNFDSCHGDTGHLYGPFLTPTLSRGTLVNVPTDNLTARDEGYMRVVPGDPERSFLLLKVGALHEADHRRYGQPMPFNAERLPQEEYDALEAWILDGATAE